MKVALTSLLSLCVFLCWAGLRTFKAIEFERSCEGYLKRAADANTVELARDQLEIAINYLEKNGLTEGYTSILYKTPDEDIGFWYKNLKSALEGLKTLDPNSTPLEKSNMLLKLRETLLDNASRGETIVTVPEGISIYPYNVIYAFLGSISLILFIFSGTVILVRY